MPLTRRELLVHSAALCAAPSFFLLQSAGKDLLSAGFAPGTLATRAAWHPYPRLGERAVWEALPEDLRRAVVDHALALPEAGPVLTASDFLEYKQNGNRSRYEAKVFGRRKQLHSLALAECVEAKGRFLARIADLVWATCEETFWGIPAHLYLQAAGDGLPDVTEPVVDLFAAETAASLALVAYLVGAGLDGVSPLLTRRVGLEVRRRVLDPCLARDDFWWMHVAGKNGHDINNWTPWICSNWLRALLLVEDDPRKRQAGVAKCVRAADVFFNAYPEDGGEEEGPGYWSRSPASLFDCAATLVAAGGAGAGVLRAPKLRAMGEYICKAHIAGRSFTNYGDAYVHANPRGAVVFGFGKAVGSQGMQGFGALLATGFGERKATLEFGDAQDMHRLLDETLLVPALRQAAPENALGASDALDRDVWYESIGLFAAREQAGFYVAAQCAATGRAHGHADSGSFLVYLDGEPVFVDPGSMAYTKATFGKERGGIWNIQSAFHNLPVVGGAGQVLSVTARAAVTRHAVTEQTALLSCDLAPAYAASAGIQRWERTVELDRGLREVRVTEDFKLARALPVSLTLMTPRVVTIDPAGRIRLAGGKGRAAVVSFDAGALAATVETVEVEDREMREQWGGPLYRIHLTAKGPVERGVWTVRVRAEG